MLLNDHSVDSTPRPAKSSKNHFLFQLTHIIFLSFWSLSCADEKNVSLFVIVGGVYLRIYEKRTKRCHFYHPTLLTLLLPCLLSSCEQQKNDDNDTMMMTTKENCKSFFIYQPRKKEDTSTYTFTIFLFILFYFLLKKSVYSLFSTAGTSPNPNQAKPNH